MKRRDPTNRTRICIPMVYLVVLAMTSSCNLDYDYDDLQYFEGYPHLTNESLGLANYLHSTVKGPPDRFPFSDWGVPLEIVGLTGMVDWKKYMLGFSVYGLSMAAEHTPAYRKPYVEAIDAFIEKMLSPTAWDYWLEYDWGGDNPIHPYNIMYTGHLQLMMAFYERQAGDQKYILNDVELITEDGLQMWTTNLDALSADIHNLILTNQDSQGKNYYAIACETNQVFVPCNSVPQLALSIIPSSLGLDPAAVHSPWIEWIEENLLDTDTMYFYPKFMPDVDPPLFSDKVHGGYSGWSWSFIYGFDPVWVEERYPEFIANALDYIAPDTAVVRWGEPAVPSDMFLLDMGSTAFAMMLARELGDQTTYEALLKGYENWAGEPVWSGSEYGYFGSDWIIFKIIPCFLSLCSKAMSAEINFRTVVESPRGPEFYEQPYLADVTNPGVFVNQAIWDDPVLYITINGAHVTKAATNLVVRNLKADRTYQVLLNDEVYTQWTQSEGEMTITTPPLSGGRMDALLGKVSTQRYQIVEEPTS